MFRKRFEEREGNDETQETIPLSCIVYFSSIRYFASILLPEDVLNFYQGKNEKISAIYIPLLTLHKASPCQGGGEGSALPEQVAAAAARSLGAAVAAAAPAGTPAVLSP